MSDFYDQLDYIEIGCLILFLVLPLIVFGFILGVLFCWLCGGH